RRSRRGGEPRKPWEPLPDRAATRGPLTKTSGFRRLCAGRLSRHGSSDRMHWSRIPVYAIAGGLLLFSFATPTQSCAYRPFISTDAAVADPKEIEIELGYFTLERAKDENSLIIPRVVFNYGWFKDWELVAEFAIRRAPDAEVNVIDPALFLKGV